MHTRECTHARAHACKHGCMHTHMYARTCACTHASSAGHGSVGDTTAGTTRFCLDRAVRGAHECAGHTDTIAYPCHACLHSNACSVVRTHVWTSVHACARAHTRIRTHARTHAHTHAYTRIRMHARTYARILARLFFVRTCHKNRWHSLSHWMRATRRRCPNSTLPYHRKPMPARIHAHRHANPPVRTHARAHAHNAHMYTYISHACACVHLH